MSWLSAAAAAPARQGLGTGFYFFVCLFFGLLGPLPLVQASRFSLARYPDPEWASADVVECDESESDESDGGRQHS
jgi:hypothetical protein